MMQLGVAKGSQFPRTGRLSLCQNRRVGGISICCGTQIWGGNRYVGYLAL